jgi:hypothetical protein
MGSVHSLAKVLRLSIAALTLSFSVPVGWSLFVR